VVPEAIVYCDGCGKLILPSAEQERSVDVAGEAEIGGEANALTLRAHVAARDRDASSR
jgi:hypothetical protein